MISGVTGEASSPKLVHIWSRCGIDVSRWLNKQFTRNWLIRLNDWLNNQGHRRSICINTDCTMHKFRAIYWRSQLASLHTYPVEINFRVHFRGQKMSSLLSPPFLRSVCLLRVVQGLLLAPLHVPDHGLAHLPVVLHVRGGVRSVNRFWVLVYIHLPKSSF